jgi:hypothetical protein
MTRYVLIFALLSAAANAGDGAWVRDDGRAIWGRTDGVVFGLPAQGGMPGPRGLIRIGIWNRETGKPDLINFIAIEPVVEGRGPRLPREGFSELEMSVLDAPQQGKRLTAEAAAGEDLTVPIEVERYQRGQHVYLMARMAGGKPNEIEFSVFQHQDSAKIEELTLSSTMGSYERLRQLWLRDRIVDSRELYAGYKDDAFVERENYPLAQMIRTAAADAVAICTTNEANPAMGKTDPMWRYHSVKLTQYWRVPKKDIQPNLRVRVNGRYTYWKTQSPIPGGITFENFEVRQRYVSGQRFIFGLTRQDATALSKK